MGLLDRFRKGKSEEATASVKSEESSPTPSIRDPEKANVGETTVDDVDAKPESKEAVTAWLESVSHHEVLVGIWSQILTTGLGRLGSRDLFDGNGR